MRYGVTGTQHGWTEKQRLSFYAFISQKNVTEFHHGDCIGVDEQAAKMVAKMFSVDIIYSHPPDNPVRRAYVKSGTIYQPKPYLERNKDVAHAVQVLIVVPRTEKETIRSGTWHTYRCGKKLKRTIILILPKGAVVEL